MGFHVKVKNERFYCCGLALSSEHQIWKFHIVIWQTASKIAPKSVPHVQHDYSSSFNQSCNYFLALLLPQPCLLLKLSISTVAKLIALMYILQGSQPTRLYHKLVLWQLGTFQGICKSTFSSWGEYGVKNDNSVVTFWSNFKWRSKYYCRKFTKLKTTKGPEDSKWLLRNLLTIAIWLLSICLYHVLVLNFPNDSFFGIFHS